MSTDEKLVSDQRLDKLFGYASCEAESTQVLANSIHSCSRWLGFSLCYPRRNVHRTMYFRRGSVPIHHSGYSPCWKVRFPCCAKCNGQQKDQSVHGGKNGRNGGDGILRAKPVPSWRGRQAAFLSFDQNHINNIRSQYLDRDLDDGEGVITSAYIKTILSMQRDEHVKLVRCLTRKHVNPSNLEKNECLKGCATLWNRCPCRVSAFEGLSVQSSKSACVRRQWTHP